MVMPTSKPAWWVIGIDSVELDWEAGPLALAETSSSASSRASESRSVGG